MKLVNKKTAILLLALTAIASMLLTACGSFTNRSTSSGAASSSATQLSSVESDKASAVSEAASANESDEVSETAFSKRDLSGEYDADGAVTITLMGSTASADREGVSVQGSDVVISEAGAYVISGTLTNGSIIVDADKEDKVQLVLNGASISSESFAAIYVLQADKVFITLAEGTENSLSNGGSFTLIDDNNVDGVVFSKDDITVNGSGSLTIVSPNGHGIVTKDELVITGGNINITASGHGLQAKDSIAISDGSITIKAGKDGLHSENDEDDTLGWILLTGGSITVTAADDGVHATSELRIDGGEIDITAAEGLEATKIVINDGTVVISASDDGVNAARKSNSYTPVFEMNGGSLTISMGAGDTDGIDSNGNLVITGGTISVTGNSSFDYDGTLTWTGGTVYVNGQQVTTIPNQMMGGGQGFGGGHGFAGGRR